MTTARRTRLAGAVMASAALVLGLAPLTSATGAGAATPIGLSPDSAVAWQKNVVLAWDAVAGATSYEVQLSNDGFDTDGPVMTRKVTTNQWAPPVSLPRGDYVWRVRATVGTGETSNWSAEAALLRGWDPAVAPVLDKADPANPTNLAVEWTAVEDASYYEVSLSPESSAGAAGPPLAKNEEIVICYTTHTSFTPYLMVGGGQQQLDEGERCEGSLDPAVTDYFIRVRGRDGTVEKDQKVFAEPAARCTGAWLNDDPTTYTATPECSAWSNEVAIESWTDSPGTGEPSFFGTFDDNDEAQPCDVATPCSDAPLFVWEDTGSTVYRLYLTRDPALSDWDRVYRVYGTQFRFPDTMADRKLPWYWRLQALTNSGWTWVTPAASFAVKNGKPAVAGASPTAGGGPVLDSHVDFTWPTSLGKADHQAKVWQLQVAKDDAFKSLVADLTGDRKGMTPGVSTARVENLPNSKLYWRYRAVDQTGRTSPWSNTLTFTHDATTPTVGFASKSGFGLGAKVTIKASTGLTGANTSTLGVKLKGGAVVDGKISQVSNKEWTFAPNKPWIPNAAYQVWVGPSVVDGSSRAAVADAGIVRPTGLLDSKHKSLKKVNGDFSWATRSASKAIGGSYVAAKHKASNSKVPYVTAKVGGSSLSLYACKGPFNGVADVVVDGAKVGSVDLYRASTKCTSVWTKSGFSDTVHTVKVLVTGKKSKESADSYVAVDAVKGS